MGVTKQRWVILLMIIKLNYLKTHISKMISSILKRQYSRKMIFSISLLKQEIFQIIGLNFLLSKITKSRLVVVKGLVYSAKKTIIPNPISTTFLWIQPFRQTITFMLLICWNNTFHLAKFQVAFELVWEETIMRQQIHF